MIDLTPLEVRKKKGDFKRTMRGYEPQAVDDFIDLVADRLEQIVREHFALNERVSSIDSQIADYREREKALTEALVSAQEMREEMRRQMEREADLKRREAEAEADAMRALTAQQREREEDAIRRLRARQAQFIQSYRGLLERELAELAIVAETLDGYKSMDEQQAASGRHTPHRATASPELVIAAPSPVMTPPEAQPPAPQAIADAPAPIAAQPSPIVAPPPEPEHELSVEMPSSPASSPPAESIESEGIIADQPVETAAPGVFDASREDFSAEPDFVGGLERAPESTAEFPTPYDADFDALLGDIEFPSAEPDSKADDSVPVDLDEEPLESDVVDIDLDEPDEDDGENDGWVSTLLEGKGD